MRWAIVFWTPLNTVCPSTANVCSSSASADGIRTAKAGPKLANTNRWPRPVACRPLARLLDPLPVGLDAREAERNFLATCSPGHKKRLLQAFSQMEAAGLDRHCDDVVVVVDMDGAKARWMLDVSPFLTWTRAALGFYLPARGRRMTSA